MAALIELRFPVYLVSCGDYRYERFNSIQELQRNLEFFDNRLESAAAPAELLLDADFKRISLWMEFLEIKSVTTARTVVQEDIALIKKSQEVDFL